MAVVPSANNDLSRQMCSAGRGSAKSGNCSSAGTGCKCSQVLESLDSGSSKPLQLGQVLLVFFVPLAAAATVVIWALRYLPGLAQRPGFLLLAALAVAGGAIVVARVLTRKPQGIREDKQDYGC